MTHDLGNRLADFTSARPPAGLRDKVLRHAETAWAEPAIPPPPESRTIRLAWPIAAGFALLLSALILVNHAENTRTGQALRTSPDLGKAESLAQSQRLVDFGLDPRYSRAVVQICLLRQEEQRLAAIEYHLIFSIMSDGSFSMRGIGGRAKRWEALDDWYVKENDGNPDYDLARRCRENPAPLREVIDGDEGKQLFAPLERAAGKPRIGFKVNYEQGPNALLPHLSYFRSLTRVLCVKAQLELLDGHRNEAWETVMNGLKMANHLQDEPLVVSQLVRFAMNRLLLDFTERNLPEPGNSPSCRSGPS
jgi:hypothetical protein